MVQEENRFQRLNQVVVIGAGLSGLVCAQVLRQAGYAAIVVEKSRGLGGRLATRRLEGTCADHGVRYLENLGSLTQILIQRLVDRHILQHWTDSIDQFDDPLNRQPEPTTDLDRPTTSLTVPLTGQSPHLYYVAPAGMTAVAKFLAQGLEIRRHQRVVGLAIEEAENEIAGQSRRSWRLAIESGDPVEDLSADGLVVTAPAPQTLALLETMPNVGSNVGSHELNQVVEQMRSVEFDPCITVIARYEIDQNFLTAQAGSDNQFSDNQFSDNRFSDNRFSGKAVLFHHHPDLAWISLETSKHRDPTIPVLVIQSTAQFAVDQFEAEDLSVVGQHLLDRAMQSLSLECGTPEILQVHRWRYAFTRQGLAPMGLSQDCLATIQPLPLVCGGDWCGTDRIEAALRSGLAMAEQMMQFLPLGGEQPKREAAMKIEADDRHEQWVNQWSNLLNQL